MSPARGAGRGSGKRGARKGGNGAKSAKGAKGAAPRRAAPGRSAGDRRGAGRGRPEAGGAPPVRRTRREGVGGDQVEGRQAVRELLVAGRRRVREVWMLTGTDDAPILDDIAELARAEHVPVREVGRAKFFAEARCESPQGVLAKAAPLPEVELEDLVRQGRGPAPFLVALDGVTDPGNLGALLRSAEGAGATGIVLPRHRAVHVTPTVAKAAAGAIEHLPFAVVGGLPTAVSRLRDLGVRVVGLDEAGAVPVWDLAATGPLALVLGAEGAGLSRLVRQRCDEVVRIPLAGQLPSLNVSVAGALACFEVARARRGRG